MYKVTIISIVLLIIAGSCLLYAEAYSEVETQYEEANTMRFDSLNVRFVGNWPFGPSKAVTCDTSRGLAFCGSGGGVYILQVSVPSNPIKISENIHTKGIVLDLFYNITTKRLYIADGDWGLEIWDINDYTNPVKLGCWCDTSSYVQNVYVSGSYAYIVDGNLRVIDVSIPTNPQEVGNFETPGTAMGVYVSGTYAYIADHSPNSLRVIDVSNPTAPHEVGYCDVFHAMDVYVSGSYAYVANRAGLWIIDVSTPSNPYEVGNIVTPGYADGGHYVSGSYAYVPDGNSGLCIIDVSTPSNPQKIGTYDTPGLAVDVFVFNNYVYVADELSYVPDEATGLKIVDVSIPSNPIEVSHYDTPDFVYNVFIDTNYAYLADRYGGFRIINISTLSEPYEVGFSYTPGNAYGVFASNSYAYVVSGDSGLHVLDISTPSNPQEVGYYNTPGFASNVFVDSLYAYVADNNSGLRVVDISIPSNPQEVGYCDTDNAYDVFVSGSYAYVVDGYGGQLVVIDVSTPSNPVWMGSCSAPFMEYAYDVCVSGQYAYVADPYAIGHGMWVIDISSPTNPFEVAFYSTGAKACGVSVSNSYGYIADFFAGLNVVDVSNPLAPITAGYYYSHLTSSVYASGSYAYVGTYYCGLQIYENLLSGVEGKARGIVSHSGLKILQNPIRGNYIELELCLTQRDNADINLFNVIGQRIRTYSFDRFSAGKHSLKLQTKNLSSGIYFLRLESGLINQTLKVTIVK